MKSRLLTSSPKRWRRSTCIFHPSKTITSKKYFAEKELNLTATLDAEADYKNADFVIIAPPTNYDSQKNFFDTSAVESVIDKVLECGSEATMVIKSTIPVGLPAACMSSMPACSRSVVTTPPESSACSSHRNSCVRARSCTTTPILRASSWAIPR